MVRNYGTGGIGGGRQERVEGSKPIGQGVMDSNHDGLVPVFEAIDKGHSPKGAISRERRHGQFGVEGVEVPRCSRDWQRPLIEVKSQLKVRVVHPEGNTLKALGCHHLLGSALDDAETWPDGRRDLVDRDRSAATTGVEYEDLQRVYRAVRLLHVPQQRIAAAHPFHHTAARSAAR